MGAYKRVIGNSNDNLTDGRKIYWKNVRKLIQYLSDNERKNLQSEHARRDKQSRRGFNGNTAKEKENKFMQIPIQERTIEKYINPFDRSWEERYYYMLFDMDIDDDRKKQICVNYLEALEWTMKYYTHGCVDWRWCYNYDYAPLLCDLIKYVPYFDTEFLEIKEKNPVKSLVQLCYVLPGSGLNLLPEDLWKKLIEKHKDWYGSNWKFKWSYCKYFWEAHAIMPEIDIKALELLIK
jgi:5'-3' exonuclease